MNNLNSLRTQIVPTWCPGCQDYVIYAGIQQAIQKLGLQPENVVIAYDIGCIGNMADFLSTYGLHTLHGRSIPTAVGVKLANPKLTVIVVGGDGGIYGEGLNHLLATARLDINITVLVANNRLYSLTTGQTSPTTPKGSKTKSTPQGSLSLAVDPVSIVKASNQESFVDHVDCKNPILVTEKIMEAINHPGFSLLDLNQLCVTFGQHLSA